MLLVLLVWVAVVVVVAICRLPLISVLDALIKLPSRWVWFAVEEELLLLLLTILLTLLLLLDVKPLLLFIDLILLFDGVGAALNYCRGDDNCCSDD